MNRFIPFQCCVLFVHQRMLFSCASKLMKIPKDAWVGVPLHYACAFGASKDVVEYLIMNENDCVRCINRFRQIPLHVACGSQCSKDLAALLIAEDTMTLEIADKEYMMPLHLVCDNGAELGLVQELIPAYPLACIAQTKKGGATPLQIAVAYTSQLLDELLFQY
jgi:ankyrin repeat protein